MIPIPEAEGLTKEIVIDCSAQHKRTIGEVAKKENHVSHSFWELISKHHSVE